MRHYLTILSLVILVSHCFAQDDKAEQKNKKIVDQEESRFRKEGRKDPENAQVYIDHANNLAAIGSEIKRANEFYLIALKLDSTSPIIYKAYGNYLAEKLHLYPDAKRMLVRGLSLAPADDEMKKGIASVDKIIEAQEADNRMRDYGTTNIRTLNPNGIYASVRIFDSLKRLVDEKGNRFYYPDQLTRFLADDRSLTPEDMYMLIVGYSKQPSYNPFNYNDIFEIRMMAGHNIDTAIRRGTELTHTNPLNPTLNRELMYYYNKKGDKTNADRYLFRIQQFFNGVLYSGNGSCDKPYISLWAKEEYNFITYLGLKPSDVHSMNTCAGQMAEIIDATNPVTNKTDAIHFNVAPIYIHTVGK